MLRDLLDLDNDGCSLISPKISDKKILFVSVNPDLKTDFGHFLNYEKRISCVCEDVGISYLCLSNKQFKTDDSRYLGVFTEDSGHYSLIRQSAKFKEHDLAKEFVGIVRKGVGSYIKNKNFDSIFVFCYCGSSVLAGYLCDVVDGNDPVFIVNAFWDFYLKEVDSYSQHLIKIKFQQKIKLLAMSELHSNLIRRTTGLFFDYIVNPPPLLSDDQSLDAIKSSMSKMLESWTGTVFMPGLMTDGKGVNETKLMAQLARNGKLANLNLLVRDRKNNLGISEGGGLKVLSGDFSDSEIIDMYVQSDVVILPYSAPVFSVRTSGAIVDSLLFGAVPIVLSNTWLASICDKYNFGVVVSELTPETICKAIENIKANILDYRRRSGSAAIKYLGDNSWVKLVDLIVNHASDCNSRYPSVISDKKYFSGLLSVGNYLYRSSRFIEAASCYAWLIELNTLSLYSDNFKKCADKLKVESKKLNSQVFH